MKILAEKAPQTYSNIMGIDPSSNKIACCMVNGKGPYAQMKVELGSGDIFDRIRTATKRFNTILDIYKPEFVIIEQSVYVQNIATMRKLSYVVGAVLSDVLIRDIPVDDVPPTSWKSTIGAKPISAAQKKGFIDEMGPYQAKKHMATLRKTMVQNILRERYPHFDWSDNDLADACAIALHGYSICGTIIQED